MKFSVLLFFSLLGLCVGSVFGAVELNEGEITTIKNMVEHDSGTGPAPAKQSEMIHEKSKVSTQAASMAELTFGDSTITRMGANTSFSFQSKERLVKLDRGTVLINTPPGAGGATVDCGGVTGAVTGTTFLASLAGDGKVMFVLLEGSPMKITSGGVVTTIKPGQAASVGLAAPDSGGGDKGGGDKAGGDKAGGDKASGDKGGGDKAGGDKAGGDQGGGDKGGGDKGGGDKPTASGGDGEKGGAAPAPAEKPRPVQVFDVDVKKMVESSPLIRDFAKPLPSAEKIQATVEVQQAKVAEGKMESLGMEVVAVKADGDVMVGSPKIEMDAPPAKEEGPAPRIEEGVAKNEGGGTGPGPDNLDIATAAGPGEGPAPIVAQDAPRVDAPRVEIPAPPAPVFNPAQNVIPTPAITSLTIRANDAARTYGEANPAFGLSVAAGSLKAGDSIVATFLTPAGSVSAVDGSPYNISIGSYRIVSSSGADVTSNYRVTLESGKLDLAKAAQTLVIAPPAVALTGGALTLAASGGITGPVAFSILDTDGRASVRPDGVVTLGKILGADTFTVRAEVAGSENYLAGKTDLTVALGRDETAILAANPTRLLISGPSDSATVMALAKFFYFTGKAADTEGPSRFFSDVSGFGRTFADYSDQAVALYPGREGDFYAMGTLQTSDLAPQNITLGSADTTIFANQMLLGERGLASRVLSKVAARAIPDFNAAGYTSELSAADLAFKADGTRTPGGIPFYLLSASLAINPADAMEMFAGDYKAYLTYMDSAGAGQTINLLDRIGTSATDREGSAANGIAATFSDYTTGQAINSATGDPIAGTFQPGSGDTLLQGTMGGILPSGTFFMAVGDLSVGGLGVLDNWSVTLAQRVKISVLNGVGKRLTLVSGLGGTEVTGTLWDVGQANLEFLSAGLMGVSDSEFYNLGTKWALESRQDLALNGIGVRGEAVGGSDVALATGGSLSLKNSKLLVNGGLTATAAVGPVKLDGEGGDVLIQAARNVVITGADLMTSAGGVTAPVTPTSLAVVRTGDSLEMRNVVIRGFSETKLESTKAGSVGRVLMSGSSVRDFKIKELAGLAVNADAKIQMMAYDATGGSEGTMTIEGRLPVAAMLASAIDNTLTGTLRDQKVDAVQIDLAARNVTLNNATMVAMQAINISAQTILVQNSLMTVIRNSGSINMYVQSGLVNTTFGGAVVTGQANFAGLNTFTIGNNTFNIGSQGQLNSAISSGNLTDTLTNGNKSEAGKVNVLRL